MTATGGAGEARTSAPTGSRLPLSQFGLGFWQAWWTFAFCTDTLFDSASTAALGVDARTLVFGLTTLGYLATLLLARPHGASGRCRVAFSRAGACGAAALCCAGSLGMAAATHLTPAGTMAGALVFLLATLLFSLGNALLLSLWGELWGALASGKVGRCLYMSYLIAFLFYFAALGLPVPVRVLLLAVLPVVSCVILALSQGEPRRAPRPAAASGEQGIPRGLVLRALTAAALLNFVWGAGLPALGMLESLDAQWGSTAGIVVAFTLLALLLAYMVAAQPTVEAFALHTPVELALAGGMLLALLLPGRLGFVGDGVMVLGGSCLDMLIMLVATDMAFKTKRPAALALSLALLVARGGSFAGQLVYGGLVVPGTVAPEQALLGCVLVVLASGFVVFTRSTLEGLYRTAPAPQEDDALDVRCAVFAREHALTAREAEILTFLVRGRSAPYISERLSIALGTTKNHVSSIYRKAGVGDRQSLLNLVEQARDAGPRVDTTADKP